MNMILFEVGCLRDRELFRYGCLHDHDPVQGMMPTWPWSGSGQDACMTMTLFMLSDLHDHDPVQDRMPAWPWSCSRVGCLLGYVPQYDTCMTMTFFRVGCLHDHDLVQGGQHEAGDLDGALLRLQRAGEEMEDHVRRPLLRLEQSPQQDRVPVSFFLLWPRNIRLHLDFFASNSGIVKRFIFLFLLLLNSEGNLSSILISWNKFYTLL